MCVRYALVCTHMWTWMHILNLDLPTSTQAFSIRVTDITTNPSYYHRSAGVLASDPKACAAGTFPTHPFLVPQVVSFGASELSLGF